MGRVKITEFKVVLQSDVDELMAYALPDAGACNGQSKSLWKINKPKKLKVIQLYQLIKNLIVIVS